MLGPNLSARDSLKKVDKTRVFIVAEEGVVSLRAKFAILPNVVENLDCWQVDYHGQFDCYCGKMRNSADDWCGAQKAEESISWCWSRNQRRCWWNWREQKQKEGNKEVESTGSLLGWPSIVEVVGFDVATHDITTEYRRRVSSSWTGRRPMTSVVFVLDDD